MFGRDQRCTASVVNRRDNSGYTALMDAVVFGNLGEHYELRSIYKFHILECVTALEQLPTNFWVTDYWGRDCLQLARLHGTRHVEEYLAPKFNSVASLRDISARFVASMINDEDDAHSLPLPTYLVNRVNMFLDRWDE